MYPLIEPIFGRPKPVQIEYRHLILPIISPAAAAADDADADGGEQMTIPHEHGGFTDDDHPG